ncbi:MAG: nuclease-related domain-containing protein [Fimbriimonas sp.]|nr:nuclease-related domain-containing protein [Fimbriimonas sp.]
MSRTWLRAAGISFVLALAFGLSAKAVGDPIGMLLVAGSLMSLSAAGAFVKKAVSWTDGAAGEAQVIRALGDLPDVYTAISNWVIPGTEQGDVDLVLIGPHGVLVIEVKNYSSKYECSGDDWVNVKDNGFRKRIKSPSRQLKRNVRAIEAYLQPLGWTGPVRGVLVLPPKSKPKLEGATVEILDWASLLPFIQQLTPCKSVPPIDWFRIGELSMS